MDLSEFDFALPPGRIAQHPARPRDSARLLAVGAGLADRRMHELPALLAPGDVLVSNDTSVIPAQLTARRGEARIGVTLDRPLPDGTWHALARNARRLRPGDVLHFEAAGEPEPNHGPEQIATDRDRAANQGRTVLPGGRTDSASGDAEHALVATVRDRAADGGVILAFNQVGTAFTAALRRAGQLALPPYIARPDGPTAADASDYQTVFARAEGAVAAPTAGLHFTPRLLAALDARGVRRVTLTLHVGAGTFLPVREADVTRHHMHAERGAITAAAAAAINAARAAGGRVVAVGTTSLRLLETAAAEDGTIRPFAGETDLFILPGYRFRAVDQLLTNFHLPRSTLFMLVCAFAGTARLRAAYAHAIATGYRFYSYGDACLLELAGPDT